MCMCINKGLLGTRKKNRPMGKVTHTPVSQNKGSDFPHRNGKWLPFACCRVSVSDHEGDGVYSFLYASDAGRSGRVHPGQPIENKKGAVLKQCWFDIFHQQAKF